MNPIESFSGIYAFLSNFFVHPLRMNGTIYRSVEHAFQAAKAKNPQDHNWIALALTCREAKRRGNDVPIIPSWDLVKTGIMLDCLRAKFAEHGFRAALLDTGNAYLLEGNTWHDNEWGSCACGGRGCRAPGKNKLGVLLMQVRAELDGNEAG